MKIIDLLNFDKLNTENLLMEHIIVNACNDYCKMTGYMF